jgi:hypothetical protein
MSQEQTNQEKSSSDKLEQVLETLTVDQIRFVVARQQFSTDKEAAQEIGIKPDTVYQWKHKGFQIDDAVRLMALDGVIVAQHLRRRNLAKAMAVKVSGLDSDDEKLRQGVATEVIEWELGRATQRKEHTGRDGGPIETKTDVTGIDAGIAEVVALFGKAREKAGTDDPPANNQ